MMKRNRKRKRTKRTGAKRRHIAGRAHDTGRGGSRASCWVHKYLTVTTKQIQALLTAAKASGGKDEYQVRLTGIERKYWMGIEIGRLGGYGFRGTVTAGDGSSQKGGKMGAGYVNLRKERKRQQRKVGCEEEGSSSNRPELAAFVLALRDTPMTIPMLLQNP